MENKTLPPLSPIPDNIGDYVQQFLQTPADPALEDWLAELLRVSSHIATADALRWRVLVMIWLAAEFDIEKSWQYLMWFNMNQPVMGDQVAELLTEAADEYGCHLQLAHWIANATDERLKTFFSGYKNIPGARQFPPLMDWLFAHPADSRTKTWLAGFLHDTVDHPAPTLRGWRILAAIWFTAIFDAEKGLAYLQEFLKNDILSEDDREKLAHRLREGHRLDAVRQWVAECPHDVARETLRPLLPDNTAERLAEILTAPADFSTEDFSAERAAADAAAHQTAVSLLTQTGAKLDDARVLVVGGGILAPDAALFGGQKIRATGVDAIVPPAYLPAAGIKQQFKRTQLKGAWKSATANYYRVLAEKIGIKPKWKSVTIIPADPAVAIPVPDGTFGAAVCRDFLPHTPDVTAVLANVARALEPGGIFVAEIVPFTALNGAFSADTTEPWAHLNAENGVQTTPAGRWLNRWRLSQYRAAFAEFFEIIQWQVEKDAHAADRLTPRFAGLLAQFAPEELTAARLWVVARKQ